MRNNDEKKKNKKLSSDLLKQKKWTKEFHQQYQKVYRERNRDKRLQYMKEWRIKQIYLNPNFNSDRYRKYIKQRKEYLLRKQYGLSIVDVNTLLKKQNNVCAICKQTMDITYIDHDHISNKVRGLLCRACNTMLGDAKDNIDILKSAINYLEITKCSL